MALWQSKVTAPSAPTKVKCFFRGGCFVAGTQIVTSEGLKNIEDIQASDIVWSRDEHTGEEGFKASVCRSA